jgi:hypothetical protein
LSKENRGHSMKVFCISLLALIAPTQFGTQSLPDPSMPPAH